MIIWAKEWKEGRLVRETTVEDTSAETRTHKVMSAITKICFEFDLPKPIWLDKTVRDFQQHAHCRFNSDAFVEEIDFDYLEIQVLEEDGYYGF